MTNKSDKVANILAKAEEKARQNMKPMNPSTTTNARDMLIWIAALIGFLAAGAFNLNYSAMFLAGVICFCLSAMFLPDVE
jgi:fatty acid desaturase